MLKVERCTNRIESGRGVGARLRDRVGEEGLDAMRNARRKLE